MCPAGTVTACRSNSRSRRRQGKPGHKISAAEFRVACRDYAAKQVDGQRADFKRLGVFGDWEHPYLTMDFAFEAEIIRSLGRIIANGHVQKGEKPVHWCIDCGSALAEAEVEYADKQSIAIDVRFPVVEPEALARPLSRHAHAVAEKARSRSSSGPPRPGPCRPTRPSR